MNGESASRSKLHVPSLLQGASLIQLWGILNPIAEGEPRKISHSVSFVAVPPRSPHHPPSQRTAPLPSVHIVLTLIIVY